MKKNSIFRKISGILLVTCMVTGILPYGVSAQSDTVTQVITDTAEYTKLSDQYNKIVSSSHGVYPNNGSDVSKRTGIATGIGNDTNACYKLYREEGHTQQSRFLLNKVTHSGGDITTTPTTEQFFIGEQTAITYWSTDVFDNGGISNITMQIGGTPMHTAVTKEQLNDNEWNTLAVVYYPNTADETKCGYADFYLNGEFTESKDMSTITVADATSAMQTRFGFYLDSDDTPGYFDNIKIYEVASFTRPDVTTVVNERDLTVIDGKITDYVTETRNESTYRITGYDVTVETVETLLGDVTVANADGTEADDTSNILPGMKIQSTETIDGIGTFTDSYSFHTIAETYIDATELESWGNGWNRIMGSINKLAVAGDGSSGIHTMEDGNVCAAYKLSGTDLTADTRFNMAECYWKADGSTTPAAVPINVAKTPVYVSVDIYDNDVLTDIMWETGGGADIGTAVMMDELNQNEWNTFAVVYYPNATDDAKLGYADFYLNGEFVSTTDLSSRNSTDYGKEIRLSFKYTKTETAAYFDNHRCYALTGFERPSVSVGSLTVTDSVISGYGSMTVAELETVLGAVIKNSDGTEPDGSAAAVSGMTANVQNTVEGVGTFSSVYKIGTPDKVLVSEDFTDTEKFKTATADRIGFSYVRESAGVGSKASDDAYLKMTVGTQDDGSDGTLDSRFAVVSEYVTDNSNGRVAPTHGNPLIYSVDIYPGEGVQSVRFDTGSGIWSGEVDADVFDRDAWNNVTLVFYNERFSADVPEEYSWESDMYVNGKLVKRAFSDYTAPKATSNLRFHIISEATGGVFYIDNINVISTAGFTRPELTSESYTISETKIAAGSVGGYKNLTVEELKDGATASGDDISVTVYNADKTVADDSQEAVTGMQMVAENNSIYGTYSRIYVLESSDFDVWAPEGYANGYVDDKFGKGVYRVENDIDYYASEVTMVATLTQYAENGEELGKSESEFEITESTTVGAQLDISRTDGTYLSYTLKNKATGEKYSEKTILPYDNTVIEKAVKLYNGFTTKAVTFGYDDGVTSDAQTVELLNKYGAKGTFNLVGKNLERYYGTDFAETVKEQYSGHEIANHTYEHKPSYLMEDETGSASDGTTLYGCSLEDAIADVTTNSKYLKDNLGVTTRGIAWPNGFPSSSRTDYADLENAVMADGHVYARYRENGGFELPSDWMEWAPTCHHKYLNKYTDQFVSLRNEGEIKLYFVWGHSYEFANAGDDETANWTLLENSLKKLSADNVWFATHGEIYDYVTALDKVIIGDYSIKNNSDETVYIHVNGENITLAPGGEYKTQPKLYAKAVAGGTKVYTNNAYGTVLAASYEDGGRFITSAFGDDKSATVITGSKNTVKGFLFRDIESISPLCAAIEITPETFGNTKIVCWGDSLTYGQESSDPATKSYPAVLSSLSGLEVENMGIGGETAITIAARQGVLDIVLTDDIKIPAEGAVEIKFLSADGGSVAPRNTELGGWNDCTIAGIKGRLEATVVKGDDGSQNVAYATFTRETAGTPIKVKAGEKIVPAANYVKGDINIIFTGTNGGWASNRSAHAIRNSEEYEEEIEALIKLQKAQTKKSTNPDKYIILGLTAGTKADWQKLTDAMAEAYGEHFIDLRAELSKEENLTAKGITPTEEDLAAIAEGAVPPSLLTDGTHYTDAGYELVAEAVYNKLKELGYIL